MYKEVMRNKRKEMSFLLCYWTIWFQVKNIIWILSMVQEALTKENFFHWMDNNGLLRYF